MNKNDLVAAVADDSALSKTVAAQAVESMINVVTKTLKKGGDVRLVGFGSFYVTKRAASEGRNPQTGAKIKIPATKLPKFKAGKSLKDAVNNK